MASFELLDAIHRRRAACTTEDVASALLTSVPAAGRRLYEAWTGGLAERELVSESATAARREHWALTAAGRARRDGEVARRATVARALTDAA